MAEAKRIKDDKLFKATLSKETVDASGNAIVEEDDEWEDLEEDFPHVKLEELMENLKLDSDEEE